MTSPAPDRISPAAALDLWNAAQDGDTSARNRLVLTFAPLAKYLAFKKLTSLPTHLDVDDLIAAGLEAIVQSIDRYDPNKGATLEQFFWTRIHGAMIDEMRHQDWAPRSVRRFQRQTARAQRDFVTLYNRVPTSHELAAALGVDDDEFTRRAGDLARADVASLNATVDGPDDIITELADLIANTDRELDPEHAAMSVEDAKALHAAINALPERERTTIVLRYMHGATLAEIGRIYGVSESRACHYHQSAKEHLAAALAGQLAASA